MITDLRQDEITAIRNHIDYGIGLCAKLQRVVDQYASKEDLIKAIEERERQLHCD